MTPFDGLLARCYIPALTVVFSRAAYDRVGGYSSLEAEDYALWTRLAALADPDFVDAFLAEYRIHASQRTQELYGEAKEVQSDLDVLQDLRMWPDLPARLLPVVESSVRCHLALVSFIDDRPAPPEQILRREDAARAAFVIRRRIWRLSELRGRPRVFLWMNHLIAAGPDFREHIGAMWASYLGERAKAAARERHWGKALAFTAALLALRVNLRVIAGREALGGRGERNPH
jgi:hypothetical protein